MHIKGALKTVIDIVLAASLSLAVAVCLIFGTIGFIVAVFSALQG